MNVKEKRREEKEEEEFFTYTPKQAAMYGCITGGGTGLSYFGSAPSIQSRHR